MMLRRLTPLLFASLALGACGGSGSATATGSSASLVPANALVFISVTTDTESEQLQNGKDLVAKFPDGARLLAQARSELEKDLEADWENEIKPAIGDEFGIAVLDVKGEDGSVVAFVKPDDPDKLKQLLAKSDDEPTVTREIDDWTVISDKQANIDTVAKAADGESLADSDDFNETMEALGDDAAMTVYVNGERALETFRSLASAEGELEIFEQLRKSGLDRLRSVGTALELRDDGVEWTGLARAEPSKGKQGVGFEETFDTTLDEEVPAGTLAFLSFTGASYRQQLNTLSPDQRSALRQFEQMLNLSIEDILDLVDAEGALYVRPGSPFPEVTLLVRSEDEAESRRTLDRLAAKVAQASNTRVEKAQVDGVDASRISFGPVSVTYAAFDGKLVVTTGPAAIEALRGDDERLSDEQAYKDALETAGVPDESAGFMYWNIEDTVPVLRSFADASGEQVPPDVWQNARPLRSFVFYATGDETEARLSAFLRIE